MLQGQHELQLVQDIRATYPDLPILVVSGHAIADTLGTLVSSSRTDFLEKPFSSEELRRRVCGLLSGSVIG